jgi:zinc/manganese transport system substrate-binding protein
VLGTSLLCPALLVVTVASGVAGCGGTAVGGVSRHTLQVIGGENFWGSIAVQLGGSHVSVTSIVTDPSADPHQYESSSSDARSFADADYVILNGAGYDDWGTHLLDANPSSIRRVLIVADLLGKHAGDNPHFWYDPSAVVKVADRITADLKTIDAANTADYGSLRTSFDSALSTYHQRIRDISTHFAGVKVGSTESIFVYLASALGVNLTSPAGFLQAVSEGNDPPASAVREFEDQIQAKQLTVLVCNVQTVTQITTTVEQMAHAEHIPVVGISETVLPQNAKFQDWQAGELSALQQALAGGPGTSCSPSAISS